MHRLLVALSVVLLMLAGTSPRAETVVRAFGPGGPAPAMKEAADIFGKRSNVTVDVVAGPTNRWLGKAKSEADVIYSGSEVMMTDFVTAMAGQIAEETITALYLRAAAVLVRKQGRLFEQQREAAALAGPGNGDPQHAVLRADGTGDLGRDVSSDAGRNSDDAT